ncbi:pseudouridine synthase [Piscinibacter sakaiensis]|uniref:pseudouridine synthase n=1 Tax=Piscinibacter sakaiensis TaxID=1547922 RepID=UPI003AAD1FAB
MATIKLKPRKPAGTDDERRPAGAAKPARPPLRGSGSGVRKRPTLAEAQAQREEADRQHQQRQRERGGDREAPARPRRSGESQSHSPRPERERESHAAPEARGARSPQRETRPPQREGRPPQRENRPSQREERPSSREERPARRDERPAPNRSARRPEPTWNQPPPAGPNRAFGAPPPKRREPDRADERPPQPARAATASSSADGSLRLSKYMTELGIASRREADEWIAKGWVRVDGRVVSELGSRVLRGQQVTIDEKARFVQAQKVTVLINKPVGYVSGQAEDGYEPAYVLVKPANQWAEDHSGIRFLPQHLRSLVPAGRLDIDSVGLLVLTQDGRIAKQLIGENSAIEKEYLVRVASRDGSPLSDEGLALLRHGLELDGQPLREAQVEWVNDDQLRFVLREGKKRQIRRMCEAVGLQVLGLKRVRIGRVMLGDLPSGQWRYLRLDERFD